MLTMSNLVKHIQIHLVATDFPEFLNCSLCGFFKENLYNLNRLNICPHLIKFVFKYTFT